MWFKVKGKKKLIFETLHIIVAPLCPVSLKRVDFYKAHRSEKRGVLWLASNPVRCVLPSFFAYAFGVMQIFPHCDVDNGVVVFKRGVLGGRGQVLTFIKK